MLKLVVVLQLNKDDSLSETISIHGDPVSYTEFRKIIHLAALVEMVTDEEFTDCLDKSKILQEIYEKSLGDLVEKFGGEDGIKAEENRYVM